MSWSSFCILVIHWHALRWQSVFSHISSHFNNRVRRRLFPTKTCHRIRQWNRPNDSNYSSKTRKENCISQRLVLPILSLATRPPLCQLKGRLASTRRHSHSAAPLTHYAAMTNISLDGDDYNNNQKAIMWYIYPGRSEEESNRKRARWREKKMRLTNRANTPQRFRRSARLAACQ